MGRFTKCSQADIDVGLNGLTEITEIAFYRNSGRYNHLPLKRIPSRN